MNAEPPHRPGDRSAPEEVYDIELAPVGLLVAADLDRIVQRLEGSRTHRIRPGALNPA